MKNFKHYLLKGIVMLNRFALFFIYALGVDEAARITSIPWQIIFLLTLFLFVYDINKNKEQQKDTLHKKINSFIKKNQDLNLTPSQIMELHELEKVPDIDEQ